jgi:hypothetical protein
MILITTKSKIDQLIKESVDQILSNISGKANDLLDDIKQAGGLQERIKELLGERTKLEIERDKKNEEYARKDREIEHKIGLERKRQEQELDLATRGAVLKAKEDNLTAERELFKKEMAFRQDRFMEEVKYQRELSEKLLQAMPKMTIKQEIK